MSKSNCAIIGGCGSSGTTLLTHLVSRHPEIGSGPEFNCFNHFEIYDFGRLRRSYKRMFSGKCLPSGYVDVHVFMTHRDVYGISFSLLEEWIQSSRDARELVSKVTHHITRTLGTRCFVEKSPTNVYSFHALASMLPDVPLVHLIRDGRDVVVSLRKRGFNLFGAGSRWLYDTIAGLRGRTSQRYLELRYENLVRDPDSTLNTFFSHLGVGRADPLPPDANVHKAGVYVEDWSKRDVPRVWNQTPSDPISTASVGRYRSSLSAEELSLLCRIALTDRGRDILQTDLTTFGELLEELGYDRAYPTPKTEPNRQLFWAESAAQLADYRRRLSRFLRNGKYRLPNRLTTINSKL